MAYDSCYFHFIFKNELSDDQILYKLISINESFYPASVHDQFREKFSTILEYKELMGIRKRTYHIENQLITILFGSFHEDMYLEKVLYKYLVDKMQEWTYSDQNCYLFFNKIKFNMANKFISFIDTSNSPYLVEILSEISNQISKNDFSLFTSSFLSLDQKLINLYEKLSSVKIPEDDLKICLSYFNLTNSIYIISKTINSEKNIPFIESLIEDEVISSPQEIELFFDFQLKKQIDLIKRWYSKFKVKISGLYSWEELLLIVFISCSFSQDSAELNQVNLQKKIQQRDIIESIIQSTNYQFHCNYDEINSSPNISNIKNMLEYSHDLINDFMVKSKNLLTEGFKLLLEEAKDTFPYNYYRNDEIPPNYYGDEIRRISNHYILKILSEPVKLNITTLFGNGNYQMNDYDITIITNIFKLLPEKTIEDLEGNFIILQTPEEPNIIMMQVKLDPIFVINLEAIEPLHRLLGIENFLKELKFKLNHFKN